MLEGVALYLQSKGIVTFDPAGVGGDVFIGVMPDKPRDAVMLKLTGGPEPEIKHPFDTRNFQVMVRGGVDPRPVEARAMAIYDALHGLMHRELADGTYVVAIGGVQSGPIDIGPDENNRHRYSLNFWARVRALTQHRQ